MKQISPFLIRAFADADYSLMVLVGFIPDEVERTKIAGCISVLEKVCQSYYPNKDAKEDKKSAE